MTDHLAGGAQLEIALAGDTVTFDQTADTFIRDMPFEYRDGRLVGDATFGDTRVQVIP